MSKLLEIFGRGITVDVSDLIWHWLTVVGLCEKHAESSQYQQLSEIVKLMGDKKLDAAEEHLKLYLFEYSSCIYGRLASAAICLYKNQLEDAIEELNSVYRQRPNNTMALYALGHCYERLDKESRAVEFYQDCLKFKNYLQLPRQRLAAIYFKNNQLEKAAQEYELLKEEYPDDISTLVILGYLYISLGWYPKAIEAFNSAILLHPDNFYAGGEAGEDVDNLVSNGQLREAIELLDTLLMEHPDKADLIAKRGDILGMLGETAEAASQYKQAIGICPDFLEATIKLGTQCLQLNQVYSAAQQFNRAVEINDEIIDAYIGLSISQKLAGDSSTALATVSLAAALQPNSSLLFAETVTLQLQSAWEVHETAHVADDEPNLVEQAIRMHQQQITADPQNPDLRYRLGMLMLNAGSIAEAEKLFRDAINLHTTFHRAKTKLALCLFEQDQTHAALEKLTCSDRLDPITLQLQSFLRSLYQNWT